MYYVRYVLEHVEERDDRILRASLWESYSPDYWSGVLREEAFTAEIGPEYHDTPAPTDAGLPPACLSRTVAVMDLIAAEAFFGILREQIEPADERQEWSTLFVIFAPDGTKTELTTMGVADDQGPRWLAHTLRGFGENRDPEYVLREGEWTRTDGQPISGTVVHIAEVPEALQGPLGSDSGEGD